MISILCGCDYIDNIKSLGFSTLMNNFIVKKQKINDIL